MTCLLTFVRLLHGVMFGYDSLFRFAHKLSAKPLLLRLLRPILTSSLHSLIHASCIQHSANNSVTEVYIFHTAPSKHNYRVLLKGVTDTGNVGGDFHTVSESNACNFADGGVRLSWSLGSHFGAYTTLKRSVEHNWTVFQNVKRACQSRRF